MWGLVLTLLVALMIYPAGLGIVKIGGWLKNVLFNIFTR